MIKGVTFTIGILLTLGAGGFGILSVMADRMSDNPSAANSDGTPLNCLIGFGIGVAIIVGACFIP